MIDLEGLAGHRGSAFGWVGQQWEGKQVSEAPEQPKTEHFVNLLAIAWRDINRRSGKEGGGGGEGGAGGGAGGELLSCDEGELSSCELPSCCGGELASCECTERSFS